MSLLVDILYYAMVPSPSALFASTERSRGKAFKGEGLAGVVADSDLSHITTFAAQMKHRSFPAHGDGFCRGQRTGLRIIVRAPALHGVVFKKRTGMLVAGGNGACPSRKPCD
jgi:hypothetical protein